MQCLSRNYVSVFLLKGLDRTTAQSDQHGAASAATDGPAITLAHGLHGQGQASLWHVRGCPGNHADAVDDGADAEAQGTACAGVPHAGQVGLGVKPDGLRTERETIADTAPLPPR